MKRLCILIEGLLYHFDIQYITNYWKMQVDLISCNIRICDPVIVAIVGPMEDYSFMNYCFTPLVINYMTTSMPASQSPGELQLSSVDLQLRSVVSFIVEVANNHLFN